MSARRAAPAPARNAPAPFALHATAPLDPAHARGFAWATLAVVGVLALVLAAIALGPHRIGDYFTETDFYGAYADGARAIQRGSLDPSRYGVIGPLYEIVLAIVGFAIRDLLTAAELIAVACTVLAVWLWARLLALRVDARLGLAAAAFLAVNPTLIRYGYSATTDALALALQAGCLFALLTRTGVRGAALAGLLGALAFLTRYNSIVLLPAGLVAIAAGGARFERRGAAALAFAAGFVAPVAPWMLHSLAHGGSFASQLHHNIAYDVFARGRGITWDAYQGEMQSEFRSLGDVIARDPVAVIARQFVNVGEHLARDARELLGLPVALCAAAGLVLGALDGGFRRLWPVLLAGALMFLALVPAFYSERYSLAVLPLYATLAAAAFASPRFALAAGRPAVWLKALLVVVPLAMSATVARERVAYTLQQLPYQVLDVAATMRAQARPGDLVLARKPHIGYHGGAKVLAFPYVDSLPGLAAYAHEHRVRWLFYSWPEATLRPAFTYLLDTTVSVPGLRLVHATPGRPANLYEIGPGFGTVPEWMRSDTLLGLHRLQGRLRVDANHLPTLRALGRLQVARGEHRAAAQWLDRAVALDPRDLDTGLLLGESWLRAGDPRRAAQVFARLAAVAPNDPRPVIGLGWARLLAGDAAGAARTWRPVVRQGGDPGTLRRMIELYTRAGDAAAVAEARAALAALGE